jgi:radical SAM family uncharacterized protein
VALLYPDTYEVGQPNQAIAILYQLINDLEGCCAERVFLPWVDMIAALRQQGLPLFTLEGCRPVGDCDLLGITLPHELAASNISEALDLAGIPLLAAQRGAGDPLVIGGGPCAYNPEPFSVFFDAFAIGEGEELISEIIAVHRGWLSEGQPREELLLRLAAIPGVYVPALYSPDSNGALCPIRADLPAQISKRVLADFADFPSIAAPIVPFAEATHDRLNIEILRGCSRGCRFCQAGMTYRPVRERSADSIVAAAVQGLRCSGYDEVALTSLSSTDHSQIEQILRRLNAQLHGQAVSVSMPSQRLDAFGVAMAQLVAGEKKAGLTFAPEAGSQRLRDIINKNVTEDDLLQAVAQAFTAGWRRCKLYFMIGLPGERDEDVEAIVDLANKAFAAAHQAVPEAQRGQVRMSVSVAVFIPKAQTPFQWAGQLPLSEIERRVGLLRAAVLPRGINLNWHDPAASLIEAVLSRGGRELGPLIIEAWRNGARFDAWSEQFSLEPWLAAARQCGIDLDACAQREYPLDAVLPWSHISCGVDAGYLQAEYLQARSQQTTADCSFGSCTGCGVCNNLAARIELAGGQRG